MQSDLPKGDIRRALEGLKDFQRKTVDYVFQRMYLDDQPARRMLISDEVGLGKTLVARGVIARALEHLWAKVKRIDVVYICSNGDIARQNVNRLRVLTSEQGAGVRTATRLTMLPAQLAKLGDVNFIALTPATSFDLGTNLGVASERATIYWLLRAAWNIGGQAAPYNVLRGNAGSETFRDRVRDTKPEDAVLRAVINPFAAALEKEVGLRQDFDELCDLFGRDRKHIPQEESRRRNAFVGRVRAALAETCVTALEPDLVILDEFQRFKHLMNDEDDDSLLARKMFNYADEHGQAKVMLLSATPYKMLTLASQGDDEDHYKDFLDSLRFLQPDPVAFARLQKSVDEFRLALLRIRTGGSIEQVLEAKLEMERGLRSVMVRTERLAATEDRSGMLSEMTVPVRLDVGDVESFVTVQEVAECVGDRDMLEYWKSIPYVLNFLEGYKIRDRIRHGTENPNIAGQLAGVMEARPHHFLSPTMLRNLEAVDLPNARIRAMQADTIDRGTWRMLWVPPCMPAYELSGAYAGQEAIGFTKQLVFSAWRMVPRALATLLSHAADHRAVVAFEGARGKSSTGASRWPSPLLRFQLEAGERLTGMPLFALIFPSLTLATFDPHRSAARQLAAGGVLPSADEVLADIEQTIAKRLSALATAKTRDGDQADERWYWMAPLMFDLKEAPQQTRAWLRQRDLAGIWSGISTEEDDQAHWSTHVERFIAAPDEGATLGPMPSDLARVLAEMALGGPAIVAYRAFGRMIPQRDEATEILVRNEAASIGWAMRNLYNLPESIVIVRAIADTEPYWRRVLQYGVEGGLQAVFDEYAHVLRESLGLASAPSADIVQGVGEAIRGALGLRAGAVGVDEFSVDDAGTGVSITTSRLRSRFAMPFADARSEDAGGAADGEVTRMEKVREAFNSPFWPFVLISTSVGQEGLDFHPYCHAVVHWNLPSNPVDLEQREGRVHRYKGHAVRKNVASAFGRQALTSEDSDPWSTVFALAQEGRPDGASDMVPYWVYPIEGGAKIERKVPALPLSRELLRMADLRRTLALYRLVFGQPRQEDLIEYLSSRFEGEELKRVCTELRVDLSPT
jgi:hypothetical protein